MRGKFFLYPFMVGKCCSCNLICVLPIDTPAKLFTPFATLSTNMTLCFVLFVSATSLLRLLQPFQWFSCCSLVILGVYCCFEGYVSFLRFQFIFCCVLLFLFSFSGLVTDSEKLRRTKELTAKWISWDNVQQAPANHFTPFFLACAYNSLFRVSEGAKNFWLCSFTGRQG